MTEFVAVLNGTLLHGDVVKPSTAKQWKNFRTTCKQALCIWVLSNLPLIFAALWQAWSKVDGPASLSFSGYLEKNLDGGEAFLYVAAFVAPFFWTLTSYNEASKRISWYLTTVIVALVTLVGSAFLFSIYRTHAIGTVAQVPYVGSLLYLFGLVVWMKSMNDDRQLPSLEDPVQEFRAGVADILKSLERP